MAQEEIGLALGLSLGSGHHRRKEESSPSPPRPFTLEPSLTLSLLADNGPSTALPWQLAPVKRELRVEEEEEEEEEVTERTLYSTMAAAEDDDGTNNRKKLRLTKEQSALLEERFKVHSTLNPKQKFALAKQLNLRPRQVEVWFQNRRARTKLKQTEVDYELLKRCCETLTEENRRLHRELQQLRALDSRSSFYMHLPAATLTICPSCERLGGAATAMAVSGDGPKVGPARAAFFNPFANPAAC